MDTKNTKVTTEAEYDRDLNSRVLARYNEHFKAQDEYLHKQMRKIKDRIDYLDRRVSKLPTKVDWRAEDVLLVFIMAILIVCAAGAGANELVKFSAWMKGSVGQPGQLICNETELILLHDRIAEINRGELQKLEALMSQRSSGEYTYITIDHRVRNDTIDYHVILVHTWISHPNADKYSVVARLSIAAVDPLWMYERVVAIITTDYSINQHMPRQRQLMIYELLLTRYGIPFTKTTP